MSPSHCKSKYMFIGQNQFCSSDLLAKIADVIDSAILITRLGNSGHYDQRIIYINQAFATLTGYGHDELLGRSIDIICDPRTGASKMLEFYNNCRNGQNFTLSIDSFKRQGSELKLKLEVRPIIDNVQGAYYYILMCKPDTAQTQSVMPESFQQYQSQVQAQTQAQPQAQYAQAPQQYYQQPQTQFASPQTSFAAPQSFVQPQIYPNFAQQQQYQAQQNQQPQQQPVQPQSYAQPQTQQQQPLQQQFHQQNLIRPEVRVEPRVEPKVVQRTEVRPESFARPEGYSVYGNQSAAAQFSAMQLQQGPNDGPNQSPDDDFGIPVAPVVNGLNKAQPAELKTDEKIADYCKTQFLSNMSHDLRTPLNAIIGFSEVIKDQLFGPIENNRYVSYASDIHKSGQELLGTINEIMELSEIEPEAERLEEDRVDLSDILESVLDVLSPKAFENDVKIIKSLDAEDVKFRGDRRKIKQVVAGVINNAIKYSKKGSKIELSTSITDKGDYRFVVYAPTAHLASTKSSLGSLLGTVTKKMENDNPEISLARKFIEAHQGKFSVFHSASSGTEMNITLPSARIVIEPEKKTWLKVIS